MASAVALAMLLPSFQATAANCFIAGDTQILSTALTAACTLSSTGAPFNNLTINAGGSIIVPFFVADGSTTFNSALWSSSTFLLLNGVVNNAGVLAATVNGIDLRGLSGSSLSSNNLITNSGTINAFSTGATVTQGTTVSQVVGLNVTYASSSTINNTGSILNFDTTNSRIGLGAGLAVNTSSGITINNGTAVAASGTISGGTGISLLGASNTTINNLAGGTVTNGISMSFVSGVANTNNTVINNAGVINHASGNAIYQLYGSGTEIDNSGTISGLTAGIVIYGTVGAEITNQVGGNINGGISLLSTADTTPVLTTQSLINNSGTISGSGLRAIYYGADLDRQLNNNAGGQITLTATDANVLQSAVYVAADISGTLLNAGTTTAADSVSNSATVTASLAGIYGAAASGSISNTGTINVSTNNGNRGAYGILVSDLKAGASLTNTGAINVTGTSTGDSAKSLIGIYTGELNSDLSNAGAINVSTSNSARTGVGVLLNNQDGEANFTNDGDIKVEGGSGFGVSLVEGSSKITIRNKKTITGSNSGVSIFNASGNTIINEANASIEGAIGVRVSGNAAGTTINNAGTITGIQLNASGVSVINSGSITAGGGGIALDISSLASGTSFSNSGTISSGLRGLRVLANSNIGNSGTIVSASELGVGVELSGMTSGGINNSGRIKASVNGVGVLSTSSNVSIGNSGNISAGEGGIGVSFVGEANLNTVGNSGTISAGYAGISLLAGRHNINNLAGGKISGLFGVRISDDANNTVVSNAGVIEASDAGVGIQFNSINNSLVNSGTVSALGAGIGLDITELAVGSKLDNTGTIEAGYRGLRVSSNHDLINAGTIAATAELGAAVELVKLSGSSFVNTGTVTADKKGIGLLTNGSDLRIENSGTITVTEGGLGIALQNGADNIVINNSGKINADFAAIQISSGQHTINNTGDGVLGGLFGVQITGDSSANTINNVGLIEASSGGVGVSLNTIDNRLLNQGTISALGSGVGVDIGLGAQGSKFENQGIISGGFRGLRVKTNSFFENQGTIAATASGGAAVELVNLTTGRFTNLGIINSVDDGVGIVSSAKNIDLTNLGQLNAGVGISLLGAAEKTTLVNSGMIKSVVSGIDIASSNNLIDNRVDAEVSGLYSVRLLAGADNNRLFNSGKLVATSQGVAVQLGSNNNRIDNRGIIKSDFAAINIDQSSGNHIVNHADISGRILVGDNVSATTIENFGTISNGEIRKSNQIVAASNEAVANINTVYDKQTLVYSGGLGGTLDNQGSITLKSSDGSAFAATVLALGDSHGQLVNQGTISLTDASTGTDNTSAAIYIETLSGGFDNRGVVSTNTINTQRESYGVLINSLSAEAQLSNSGTISVSSSSDAVRNGVAIVNFEDGATLNNTGSIDSVFIGQGYGSEDDLVNFNLSGSGSIDTLVIQGNDQAQTNLQFSGDFQLPGVIVTTGSAQAVTIRSADSSQMNLSLQESTLLGNLKLGNDTVVNVDLGANGNAGRLNVDGAVFLPSSTVINAQLLADDYSDGQLFTIIDGTVDGSIELTSKVNDSSLLYNFYALHNDQDLLIQVSAHQQGRAILQSWSQAALQQADPALYQFIKASENTAGEDFNQLLLQLSPDQSGSVFSSYREDAHGLSSTINQRLSVARADNAETDIHRVVLGNKQHYKPSFWVQAFGSTIEQQSQNGSAAYDSDTQGLAMGIDTAVTSRARLGLGFGQSQQKSNSNFYRTDSESLFAFAYGSYETSEQAYIESSVSYGVGDYDSRRAIQLLNLERKAVADFDTQQLSGHIRYGKNYRYNNGLRFSPYIGGQYSQLQTEAYGESGAGGANLNFDKNTDESLEAVLGVSLATVWATESGYQLRPEVNISWRRELMDNPVVSKSRFSDVNNRHRTAVDRADDIFTVGAKVSLYRDKGLDISANYDYSAGHGYQNQSGFLSVKIDSDFRSPFKRQTLQAVSLGSSTDFDLVALDLSELSPIQLENPSYKLGQILSVDDYRYSSVYLNGLSVDSGQLNFSAADGFRSVSTYVGNTPMLSNTSVADFDHINYFERYDASSMVLDDMPSASQYGNSSLAGVIKYTPNRAVLGLYSQKIGFSSSRLQGSASGELGNGIDGVWNLPLAKSVALRIAGGRIKTEGSTDYVNLYALNDAGAPSHASYRFGPIASQEFEQRLDSNSFYTNYGRANVFWRASQQLELELTAYHQKDFRGGNRVSASGKNGFGLDYKPQQSGALVVEPKQRETNALAVDVNFRTDEFELHSNTSRFRHQGSLVDDITGAASNISFLNSAVSYCENTDESVSSGEFCFSGPLSTASSRPLVVLDRRFSDKGYSQEFKFKSISQGPLTVDAGLYFKNLDRVKGHTINKPGFVDYSQNNGQPNALITAVDDRWSQQQQQSEIKEAALFGNADYSINQQWQLSLGLKYLNYRSKEQAWRSYPMFEQQGAAHFESQRLQQTITDDAWLPSLGLRYQIDDNAEAYLKLGRGFRAGGLNANAVVENQSSTAAGLGQSSTLVYKSEFSSNAIVGVRGRHTMPAVSQYPFSYEVSWVSRTAKDKQFDYFNNSRDSRDQLQQQLTGNLDSASQQSLEIKLASQFNRRWSYALNYNFNYKAQVGQDFYQANSVSRLSARVASAGGQVMDANLDASPNVLLHSGDRLSFTPRHAAVLRTDYLWPLDSVSVRLFASVDYRSSMKSNLLGGGEIKAASTANLALSLLWDDMDISLWANNLNNQKNSSGGGDVSGLGPKVDQAYYGSGNFSASAMPRNIGVSLNYKF